MSASMSPTRWPSLESATAKLTATVVLPTPPLPEPTATIFATPGSATGAGIACECAIITTPLSIQILQERAFERFSRPERGRHGSSCNTRKHRVQLAYAFRQGCGPGLQDARGGNLVDVAITDCGDALPAGPRANLFFFNLFAAPRSEDCVGVACDHCRRIDHAILRFACAAQRGKDRVAAGKLDQLLYPLNAADERIVPLLEVDARPAWKGLCRFANCIEAAV